MANYNQMAQIIKDSAGVSQQEIADSTRVTLPSGLGTLTPPPSAQEIKDSTGVTQPTGLEHPVLETSSVEMKERKRPRPRVPGGGGVADNNVGNNGAYDVVSDFDYYKNKLEQDGTGALVRNKYESQVKQTATESARYVAENMNKGNQSFEQNAYVAAQTADKLGWSGGYALDAARQVEYLRASIQADIFSQQELQKLGYKSNLEAAYASAELELNEQAQDNYYQAQEIAINQAQLTGKYIDPAIADMCIQASAAQDIMNSKDPSSEEYKKAEKVYNYMAANLKARGNVDEDKKVQITPVAIQTLADIQKEMDKLTFQEAQLRALESMEESGKIVFPVIGDDGQFVSWTSSPYAAFNGNLKTFYEDKQDAFTTKVNQLLTNMSTGYQSWLQMEDKNGRLINAGKSFEEFMTTAYKNPNTLTDLLTLVETNTDNTYTQGDITVKYSKESGKWTVVGPEAGQSTSPSNNSNIVLTDIDGGQYGFDVQKFGGNFNLMVNTNGDDLSNSHGTICRGDNMSLKVPGEDEIYRVEIGYQVEYGTALDQTLNKISTAPNSIAYIGGTIFVRDNDAWYQVQRREISYHKQWDEFQARLKEYFGTSDEDSAKFAKLITTDLYDNYRTVQGRRNKVK